MKNLKMHKSLLFFLCPLDWASKLSSVTASAKIFIFLLRINGRHKLPQNTMIPGTGTLETWQTLGDLQ